MAVIQSLKEKLLEMLGVKDENEVTEQQKKDATERLNTKKRKANSGNRSVRDQLETWEGEND